MGIATGLTAERMLEIEASSIVEGSVNGDGDLILRNHAGVNFNAGHVKGEPGEDATALLGVSDTPSLDLTLTGSGTTGSPWGLSGNVIGLADGAIVEGILDETYLGIGPAKVYIDGVLSSVSFPFFSEYKAHLGPEVRLIKIGDSFAIIGQIDNVVEIPIHPQLFYYNDYNNSAAFPDKLLVKKLSSGMVSLSGLLYASVALTNSTVIATLPEGMRPPHQLIMPILQNQNPRAIIIYPNGEIRPSASNWVAGYFSFDGISFYPDGVGTWIEIGTQGSSYAAGCTYHPTTANFGKPAVYLDPYGVVWMRGLLYLTTNMGAGGTLVNLPTTIPPPIKSHYVHTTGNNVYSCLSFKNARTITWETNSQNGSGSWLSLSNNYYYTSLTPPETLIYTPPTLANSWTNYPTDAYLKAGVLRRKDGLVMYRGLFTPGTFGQTAFRHTNIFNNRHVQSISQAMGYSGTSRFDFFGSGGYIDASPPGSVRPNISVTGYFSLDNVRTFQ